MYSEWGNHIRNPVSASQLKWVCGLAAFHRLRTAALHREHSEPYQVTLPFRFLQNGFSWLSAHVNQIMPPHSQQTQMPFNKGQALFYYALCCNHTSLCYGTQKAWRVAFKCSLTALISPWRFPRLSRILETVAFSLPVGKHPPVRHGMPLVEKLQSVKIMAHISELCCPSIAVCSM